MGDFKDLISQGVYCESCGCFTGVEPGHPTKCFGCEEKEAELDIENAIERGEEI